MTHSIHIRWAFATCLAACLLPASAGANGMNLQGLLTDGPACSLFPGDENITVDFGNVGRRDIDEQGEAGRTDFELRLVDCDLQQAQTVTMTFNGTPSNANPDWLALAPASAAAGIAIALETRAGDPLALGQPAPPQTLLPGPVNRIELSSVLRDEDSARPVTTGQLTAVADFLLEYP